MIKNEVASHYTNYDTDLVVDFRGIFVGSNMYIWRAYNATHLEVAKELALDPHARDFFGAYIPSSGICKFETGLTHDADVYFKQEQEDSDSVALTSFNYRNLMNALNYWSNHCKNGTARSFFTK